jgi:hypothetical protein
MDREMRIEVLEKALEEVEKGLYICNAITGALAFEYFTDEWCGKSSAGVVLGYFPEFLKYKPAGVDINCATGWFGKSFSVESTEKRVEVLKALINEIKTSPPAPPHKGGEGAPAGH